MFKIKKRLLAWLETLCGVCLLDFFICSGSGDVDNVQPREDAVPNSQQD